MSSVYVVQIPKRGGYLLDVSPAREFGEILEPCFAGNIDVSKNTEATIEAMNEYFKDFTEGDFILQAGEHTLFAAACVTAAGYVDSLNILRWDRELVAGKRNGGRYIKIEIPVYE